MPQSTSSHHLPLICRSPFCAHPFSVWQRAACPLVIPIGSPLKLHDVFRVAPSSKLSSCGRRPLLMTICAHSEFQSQHSENHRDSAGARFSITPRAPRAGGVNCCQQCFCSLLSAYSSKLYYRVYHTPAFIVTYRASYLYSPLSSRLGLLQLPCSRDSSQDRPCQPRSPPRFSRRSGQRTRSSRSRGRCSRSTSARGYSLPSQRGVS